MDRLVNYELLGETRQAIVPNAQSDQEAKAAVLAQIAKSFRVINITTVRPKKRTSLWDTYKDGFRTFFSFTEKSTKLAESILDSCLEEAFPSESENIKREAERVRRDALNRSFFVAIMPNPAVVNSQNK